MSAGQVEITVHIISRCYGTADSRGARLVRPKPILIALSINKLYYRLIAKRISDARAVHPYDSDLVFASIQGGLIEGTEEAGGGAPSEGHVAAGGAEKEAVETRLLFVDGCREEAAGGCGGVFACIVAGKQRAAQVGVAAQPAVGHG